MVQSERLETQTDRGSGERIARNVTKVDLENQSLVDQRLGASNTISKKRGGCWWVFKVAPAGQ